jgi:hypothetical protein
LMVACGSSLDQSLHHLSAPFLCSDAEGHAIVVVWIAAVDFDFPLNEKPNEDTPSPLRSSMHIKLRQRRPGGLFVYVGELKIFLHQEPQGTSLLISSCPKIRTAK